MFDHLSVEEIQKNINNRQISIKEVLVYYLERIEKFNKDINAIILQKDRELLIKEAEQKDNLKNSKKILNGLPIACLLYTSPSPRDVGISRMPSSA